MENKIFSVVRLAVAGVAIMGGVAALNATSTQRVNAAEGTTVMTDGTEPLPLCSPKQGPNCGQASAHVQISTTLKDGTEPLPLCAPKQGPNCGAK